jgi:O-antigen/teichoic acid export membrane protein
LFFFLRTIKLYPPNNLTDPETIPYGIQSSFIDFLASIISSIDQILIFHYLGATELAFFTFATAPVTQIISVFKNIPALAMPKMAPRPVQEINNLIYKRTILAFLGSLLVIGAYYICAPFIYKIFFPSYLDSIKLSRIFVITAFFSIPIAIMGPAVNSKVTYIPKKLLYFWNVPGIVATLFIFITIQKIGVVSVIYSRIILVGTTFLISWLFWQYIVKKDKTLISNTNQENPVQIAP